MRKNFAQIESEASELLYQFQNTRDASISSLGFNFSETLVLISFGVCYGWMGRTGNHWKGYDGEEFHTGKKGEVADWLLDKAVNGTRRGNTAKWLLLGSTSEDKKEVETFKGIVLKIQPNPNGEATALYIGEFSTADEFFRMLPPGTTNALTLSSAKMLAFYLAEAIRKAENPNP